MATDVLKVPGDYLLQTAPGGLITLDLATTGTVIINGNLQVKGTETVTSATNVSIKDNIFIINSGENYPETHSGEYGITLGTAGILIARGNNDDATKAATIIYNETVGDGFWTDGVGNTNKGIFEFKVVEKGSAIKANAIRIDAASTTTLNLLGAESGDAMLNVKGQVDYHTRVVDDDDIPNKKYVDSALFSGTDLAKQLKVLGTTLVAQDNAVTPVSDPYYNPVSRLYATLSTTTNIVFELYGTSARIQGITIDDTTINANTSTDLVLQPQVGNYVEVREGLKLGTISTSTTVSPESTVNTIYYTDNPGGGGTGIYYVNTNNSDELVSRRKSIIYGIIF